MEVMIDPDVKSVAEFMQRTVPAAKLGGVAKQIAEIAGLLWGHYEPEDVDGMRLVNAPIDPDDPHKQASASEPPLAA